MLSLISFNPYNLISYLLLSLAFYKLFEKCEMDKKMAFIPFYRMYKLAEYVEREEDGKLMLLTQFICYGFSVISNYLQPKSVTMRSTFYMVTLLYVVFAIMNFIYSARVFSKLTYIFGCKKIWILLWLSFTEISALVFAFNKKYQPINKVKRKKIAAGLSGIQADTLEEGLTINIENRTVKSFLKSKCLLKDIHLNLHPGRMVLLLGGSGAGKTTFINAVTGYETANASILLNGEDVYRDFERLKYDIGVVPQQDLVRYNDTVEKTLSDMATLRLPTNVSREERNKRVAEVLDIFGLTPVKDNLVGKQSGGQKKRISIASEFISDPYLFILDEPDSGLDGILARELMERLHAISREGKIVMVITHTPDRVIDLFDDIIVLAKDQDRTGRLVFFGPIEEAKEFFHTDRMENIVRMINRTDEGGQGKADELIEKYKEVRHES